MTAAHAHPIPWRTVRTSLEHVVAAAQLSLVVRPCVCRFQLRCVLRQPIVVPAGGMTLNGELRLVAHRQVHIPPETQQHAQPWCDFTQPPAAYRYLPLTFLPPAAYRYLPPTFLSSTYTPRHCSYVVLLCASSLMQPIVVLVYHISCCNPMRTRPLRPAVHPQAPGL